MTSCLRRATCLAFAMGLIPAAGCSHPPSWPKTVDPTSVGTDTERWLDLQREGSAAAPSHGMPAQAAQRAQDRYLRSFEHPIPERFDEEDR